MYESELKIRANLLFNLFVYVYRKHSFVKEFKNLARCRSENNFIGLIFKIIKTLKLSNNATKNFNILAISSECPT